MAEVFVRGAVAELEVSFPVDDDRVLVECRTGGCSWSEHYDDLRDALGYAGNDHADRGYEHRPLPA